MRRLPPQPRADRGRPFDLRDELLSAVDGADPAHVLRSEDMARGGPWENVAIRPKFGGERGGAGGTGGASDGSSHFGDGDVPAPSGPRDAAAADRRLDWFIGCHRLARTRTSLRVAGGPFSVGGVEPTYFGVGSWSSDYAPGAIGPLVAAAKASGPAAFERGYYALKTLTFRLGAALAPLWATVPQAATGFHTGPWIEDFWLESLARPARRSVLEAELQFELELLRGARRNNKRSADGPVIDGAENADGAEGSSASDLWSETRLGSAAAGRASFVVLSRVAARGAFLAEDTLTGGVASERLRQALVEAHRKGTARPTEAIETARAAGAPTAEVLYALDYDLFFPFVPVFVPWERLSFVFQRVQEDAGGGGQGRTLDVKALSAATAAHNDLARLQDALRFLAVPSKAAFVTVAQRAQGVLLPHLEQQDIRVTTPPNEVLVRFLAKTLVINSGGGGDLPVPLLARELPLLDEESLPPPSRVTGGISASGGANDGSGSADDTSPLVLSFVGRVYKGGMREILVEQASLALGSRFRTFYDDGTGAGGQGSAFTYVPMAESLRAELDAMNAKAGLPSVRESEAAAAAANAAAAATAATAAGPTPNDDKWRSIMARSYFQLAPSGTNPTSFRLYEALQMGLVPVFVFDDGQEQAWLPYHGWHDRDGVFPAATWRASDEASGTRLWHRVAIIVPVSRFSELLELLPELAANATYMEGKRAYARAARNDYFTYAAVVRHLWRLFDDPASADLQCQQPPVAFF